MFNHAAVLKEHGNDFSQILFFNYYYLLYAWLINCISTDQPIFECQA